MIRIEGENVEAFVNRNRMKTGECIPKQMVAQIRATMIWFCLTPGNYGMSHGYLYVLLWELQCFLLYVALFPTGGIHLQGE